MALNFFTQEILYNTLYENARLNLKKNEITGDYGKMENKNKYLQMLKTFVSNIWYVIALVLLCTIIICLIMNWEKTITVLSDFISIMMPFIIGLFFAYLIKPLVNLLLKGLNRI